MISRAGPRIAWFVSDHGWGHAARQRELMLAVRDACPGARIGVVTGVPEWFWNPVQDIRVACWASGPVPVEKPGRIDAGATLVELMAFPERIEEMLGECLAVISGEDPDLVVIDIDPVPAAASFKAGVDCLAISNFTWDWIYREMFPDQAGICDELSGLYRSAHYLRLPLGPDHSPFRTCEDVGLVPGGSPRGMNRAAARSLLGPRRALLVTLRDSGRLGATGLEVPQGWRAVCSLPFPGPTGVDNIPPSDLEARGIQYADLAAEADAMLITPGYGTVSLALSLGKPLIAVERDDFPEVPFLLAPLRGREATRVCASGALAGEGLGEALEEVSGGPPPVPLSCDTDYVVSRILTAAGHGAQHGLEAPGRGDLQS